MKEPCAARSLNRAALASALREARARTLGLYAAFEQALGPSMPVPMRDELNPPLWELGHIGWFADRWIGRHLQRHLGTAADPQAARRPARQARRGLDADAVYDSSLVPHALRWHIALPDLDHTLADLQASLDDTLQCLAQTEDTDQGLYFFRLALFHEDMHAEAAVHMAQTLGIAPGPWAQIAATEAPPGLPVLAELALAATEVRLGWEGAGFAFDNELGAHTVKLAACHIDAAPVSWARFLPFVEAGGYLEPRWWTPAGWDWRSSCAATAPRFLRRQGDGWEWHRFGSWVPVQPKQTAVHLNAHEAQAWCRWAGRRLPTEAEWMAAARHAHWQGMQVWEWTASRFQPFPGFEAHPYRDYSAPWFDGRPVLKGASPATAARLRHPAYRNFYTPQRNDILAGFRSVAA
ncbi:selenoneine synthase SenA [uncultured Hydrogenophaga sp.]|uniref:selenoneine synthase SenA n=1 Tax=uncultured Hydrogenophaga sp. TaxID=199683 RepID=UPI0026603C4C|nr:selenoneine synthase SenA [uncultured Hydrogenophaga sp.]